MENTTLTNIFELFRLTCILSGLTGIGLTFIKEKKKWMCLPIASFSVYLIVSVIISLFV